MYNSPVFGFFLTLSSFYIGTMVYKKIKNPILNPLIIGIALTVTVLITLKISYSDFMVGASYLQFMIMPATVVLVIPLFRNWDIFLQNKLAVLAGSLAGSLTAMLSILVLGKVFDLDPQILISLLPKSITTAIALPVSEELGGIQSITAFAVASTGIFGVVICEPLFELFRIKSPVAKGAALGTAAHAIGTSKAFELGDVEGAISGLCIVLSGIITVLILPLLLVFFH